MLNLLIDISLLATIPLLGFVLALFNREKPTSAERASHRLLIGFRILLVSIPAVGVFYLLFGIPATYLLPAGLFLVLLVAISDIEYCLNGDAVGTAIALVLTLPLYAVKQFVLGFPKWNQLAILPEKSPGADAANSNQLNSDRSIIATNRHHSLIGILGIVSAELRPTGYVNIGNQEYPAKSIDGFFVERGRAVRVIKMDQNKLTVQCEND